MNEAERLKLKIKRDKNKELVINICIILFIAFIICFGIINFPKKYEPDPSLYVNYDLSKDIIPNPTQKNIEKETFSIQKNGLTITFTKLASYDITGKVEGIKDYSTNVLSNFLSLNASDFTNYISPRDLALSWGEIALEKNSDSIIADQYIFNNTRTVLFTYHSNLISKYGKEYITTHVSNNHIITLNNELKNELMKITQLDVVRIIGYLVDVKCNNGWSWGPSSMVRNDTGCEIILAEDIIINKK